MPPFVDFLEHPQVVVADIPPLVEYASVFVRKRKGYLRALSLLEIADRSIVDRQSEMSPSVLRALREDITSLRKQIDIGLQRKGKLTVVFSFFYKDQYMLPLIKESPMTLHLVPGSSTDGKPLCIDLRRKRKKENQPFVVVPICSKYDGKTCPISPSQLHLVRDAFLHALSRADSYNEISVPFFHLMIQEMFPGVEDSVILYLQDIVYAFKRQIDSLHLGPFPE